MIVTLRCPAKINTFLAVGPLDHTGYHPIRTVFQAVGLYDTLTVSDECDRGEIICNWQDLPKDNTLTKVIRLVSEIADLPPLHIQLDKEIPAQSGLGGGSSDAAALLRAMPRFVDGLEQDQMEAIAAAVGADVPYFLVGGRARGEGYGEKLAPLSDLAQKWILIARPPRGTSTPEAYRRLDEIRYSWRDFPGEDRQEFYNDFERVALPESLMLIKAMKELGAEGATLCGSGSAVFGQFVDQGEASRAMHLMESLGHMQWLVPTLTRKESLWIS